MRRTACLAVAAAFALLTAGIATPARADLQAQLSTNANMSGYTIPTGADQPDGGSFSVSPTYNSVAFTNLGGGSNSPGSQNFTQLLSSTLNIANNTNASKTVYITIGAQNFTAPVVPPGAVSVNSHVGGSTTGTVSFSFTSYINSDNGQNSLTGSHTTTQTFNLTPSSNSFSSDAYLTLYKLGAPFSVTEYMAVTLGAHSSINFGGRTNLSTPEPSTMALAGLGTLGLVGYGLRRRKAMGA